MGTQDGVLRVFSGVLFTLCAATVYAQKPTNMTPMSVRKEPVDITTVRPFTAKTILQADPSAAGKVPRLLRPIANVSTSTGAGGNIFGLQTVPTFAGAFSPEAGPSYGSVYPFIMMGNDPLVGGTTTIPAKITEVSLALLNLDGTTFTTVPFTSAFDDVVTDSPNFANFSYDSSGVPTQFADAVQRAEYFHLGKSSWHTKLGGPTVVNRVTIGIPKTVQVQFSDGTVETVTAYYVATAGDGSTVVFLLNLLFDADYFNLVVNDLNAGNFTTSALNMTLFPNTFLFSTVEGSPNTPGPCCVLGFHTYFYQYPTVPQPRWITLFASYISPGVFGGGFQDVTGLSHEISESFNDPFLNNPTAVWQFPGQPANSTVCQSGLETGDPIEGLSNAVFPITLTEGTTSITFHPQNEALLQWFEMGASSNAVDGAFSYPDETVLTQSAIPCP